MIQSCDFNLCACTSKKINNENTWIVHHIFLLKEKPTKKDAEILLKKLIKNSELFGLQDIIDEIIVVEGTKEVMKKVIEKDKSENKFIFNVDDIIGKHKIN